MVLQIEAQGPLSVRKVSQVKVDSIGQNTGKSTMFKKNIIKVTLNGPE